MAGLYDPAHFSAMKIRSSILFHSCLTMALWLLGPIYGQAQTDPETTDQLRDYWWITAGLGTNLNMGNLRSYQISPQVSVQSPVSNQFQWEGRILYNLLRAGGEGLSNELDITQNLQVGKIWKLHPSLMFQADHSTIQRIHFRALAGVGVDILWWHTRSHFLSSRLMYAREWNDWIFEKKEQEDEHRRVQLQGPAVYLTGKHVVFRDRLIIDYGITSFLPFYGRYVHRSKTWLNLSFHLTDMFSLQLSSLMTMNGWTPPKTKRNDLWSSIGFSLLL